jgi:hypothetical protein
MNHVFKKSLTSRGSNVRELFLGDSYDLVKRFWSESLRSVAPLYAHSRFVPSGIRAQYLQITGIPVLDTPPVGPFGILLDPHTGIPLPNESAKGATVSHASLPFIVQVDTVLHPTYIICFDQSHLRSKDVSNENQRHAKQKFLLHHRLFSFYYISHAPFLFAAAAIEKLDEIRNVLRSCGIPKCRFDCLAELKPHTESPQSFP